MFFLTHFGVMPLARSRRSASRGGGWSRNGPLHGAGHVVGVQDHLAVEVAGGAADGQH